MPIAQDLWTELRPLQRAAEGKSFSRILQAGKITFDGGLPDVSFRVLYENVMEGMFADPIYGGNKDKIA